MGTISSGKIPMQTHDEKETYRSVHFEQMDGDKGMRDEFAHAEAKHMKCEGTGKETTN